MRISTEWLREYVALPSPDELAHVFEMAGIGVEDHEGELFSLEVTSNRGDWLSAIGLAREIGAMTDHLMRVPAPTLSETGEPIQGRVQVEIENGDDCPRYVARLIENVKIGPSPEWMQHRLEQCGMRPINNIVDVTNYVMLETGQPLHAFDADKIVDKHITVRRAHPGERITTLDGVEHTLNEEVLLITGRDRPLAAAGIMGGLDSEVTESTRNILLESAHFDPLRVQRGKRKLGFGTEASRRFERWVDPNGTLRAADRAAQLLQECAGGTVAQGAIDRYVKPMSDAVVNLRPARCNAVLGLRLSTQAIITVLERLGLRVQRLSEENLQVSAPTWRRDITREIDLIEEVARVHGYDHIPTTLPRGVNIGAGRALSQRLEEQARSALVRCGLTEIVTYTLQSAAAVERAGLLSNDSVTSAIKLRNPISEDYTQLRTSLIPSLLETLATNARYRVQLFELGKVYLPRDDGSVETVKEQPNECRRIAIGLLDAPVPRWQKGAPEMDFFFLKGVVEQLLHALGTPAPQYQASQQSPFHPGRCASLSLDGQDLGVLGEVHPAIAEGYGLKHRAYLATLEFDALVRHISLIKAYTPLMRFPAIERDLALVLRAEVPAGTVQTVLRNAAGSLLESIEVFDVYSGSPIEAGFKSVALALRFRATDRTLTDAEVESTMHQIQAAATRELNAQLRT
ncbi:MAG: phenylalanine--tRNA ligase subunit beta [Abitibacteriaceae bacterium]|nr:phenylalanine--tRNA ligase subunit beta [Abditibacteriaceae bacterium]MBV9864441.1 phenylalanine--tRNA ligase subunit beta [Abditibacteriaceae bacterium]